MSNGPSPRDHLPLQSHPATQRRQGLHQLGTEQGLPGSLGKAQRQQQPADRRLTRRPPRLSGTDLEEIKKTYFIASLGENQDLPVEAVNKPQRLVS